MKCANCEVEINKAFKAALTQNKCPACGNRIVNSDQMECFVSLQDLLLQQVGEEKSEELAVLLVSSFDVLPKGKASLAKQNPVNPAKQNIKKVLEDIEKQESAEDDYFDSQESEVERLRKEAYDEAIREQWGLGKNPAKKLRLKGDPDIEAPLANLFPVGTIVSTNAEQDIESKQIEARENVLNGARGSFKRSS